MTYLLISAPYTGKTNSLICSKQCQLNIAHSQKNVKVNFRCVFTFIMSRSFYMRQQLSNAPTIYVTIKGNTQKQIFMS